MSSTDILILVDPTRSKKMRHIRLDQDLRQTDLAYLASQYAKRLGKRITIRAADVSWMERGYRISQKKEAVILGVLGIDADG